MKKFRVVVNSIFEAETVEEAKEKVSALFDSLRVKSTEEGSILNENTKFELFSVKDVT